MFGEKDKDTGEVISTGMKPQHDEMYRDYTFGKRFIYVLYAFIGFLGIRTIYDIIPVIQSLVQFLEKVKAVR